MKVGNRGIMKTGKLTRLQQLEGETYGIGGIEGAVLREWGFVEWEEQGGSDGLIHQVLGEVDKHQGKYALWRACKQVADRGSERDRDVNRKGRRARTRDK